MHPAKSIKSIIILFFYNNRSLLSITFKKFDLNPYTLNFDALYIYRQCREMQPVCSSGSQAIKYAWAKNAPSLEMPPGKCFEKDYVL